MTVDVNYLAVFLAAVASMAVGAVWYQPKVFGNAWMRLTGIKMDKKPSNAEMARLYGLTFVASLITAYILAHVTFLANYFFGNSFLQDATATAFWVWLGFTATRVMVHDLFEGRPGTLTFITALHELVTLEAMAVVIGLLRP